MDAIDIETKPNSVNAPPWYRSRRNLAAATSGVILVVAVLAVVAWMVVLPEMDKGPNEKEVDFF